MDMSASWSCHHLSLRTGSMETSSGWRGLQTWDHGRKGLFSKSVLPTNLYD